jgi:hypothetical protein
MADTKKEKKPSVKLVGQDGNAFAILARCRAAARRAKWTPERIQEFADKASSGDYNNLLCVCMEYFDVR